MNQEQINALQQKVDSMEHQLQTQGAKYENKLLESQKMYEQKLLELQEKKTFYDSDLNLTKGTQATRISKTSSMKNFKPL